MTTLIVVRRGGYGSERNYPGCGFTVPAQGGVYWNGEAMTTTDFKDLDETPEAVATTITTMSSNAVHLAGFLKATPYSPS